MDTLVLPLAAALLAVVLLAPLLALASHRAWAFPRPAVVMELKTLLLLVAFRNRIREPDLDGGRLRFADITGTDIDLDDFQMALAWALTAGYIHDPVQLPAGALQCHWNLALTSGGVSKVQALLRDYGKSADELIDAL